MNKFFESKIFNINNKKYKLNKPYEFKFSKSKIGDRKLEIIINDFLKVMLSNFEKENLSLLFSNLDTLSAVKVNNSIFEECDAATYNILLNTIIVRQNKKGFIYHELFHMASASYIKEKQMCYSGFFQQKILGNGIGRGLTEGYTDLLTKRFFPEEAQQYYDMELALAKMIEIIVGKEKMQVLYLNANLPGLVTKLEKYCSNDEILKLLQYVDDINEYVDDDVENVQALINAYKNAYLILMKCYAHKYALENDSMENEAIYKSILLFHKNLPDIINIDGKRYTIISEDDQVKLFYNYCMEQKNKNLYMK